MSQSLAKMLSRGSSLDKLKSAVTAANKSKFAADDEGYWRPTPDKIGNASAVIRFLPAPEGEDIPFASYYRHSFKSPAGKWYIERSLTSINQDDPLGQFNTKLWNSGNQDQARAQARKLTFVSNIYVINDQGNPENNGKVFLYSYGKKIFDKIRKSLEPEFGDPAVDPFHMIEGANFRLRQKKQQNFPNYDDSSFEAPKPLLNGDMDALEEVFKQVKSIADIVAPDKFKSFADLKNRLDSVMGFDTSVYLSLEQAMADSNLRVGSPTKTTTAQSWKPPVLETETDDEEDKFADD